MLWKKLTRKAIFFPHQMCCASLEMSHEHDGHCNCKPTAAVQSLDEMDFDRGIWSAGTNYMLLWRIFFINITLRFFISQLSTTIWKNWKNAFLLAKPTKWMQWATPRYNTLLEMATLKHANNFWVPVPMWTLAPDLEVSHLSFALP